MKATDRFPRSLRRLAVVLATLLMASAAALAQSPAPKQMVADVIIPPGNYQLPVARIMGMIKTRSDTEYNQATVNEDVRQLYQTRAFANVNVRLQDVGENKVVVYFLLTGLPSTVQEIVYNGADHLAKDELETITNLRKGVPMNPLANQAAKNAIMRKYQEKGRLFASVELVEGTKPTDTRVVFNITEGRVVKVSKIDFEGNTFVVAGRLRTQTNSSACVLGMLGGDYNAKTADEDCSALEKYYKTFGFQDVVVSRELQWDDDHDRVKLIFHIKEGQRYRVTDVQLVGTKSVDQEKLLAAMRQKSGQYYDRNLVQADINSIKDVIGYTGHDVVAKEELTWTPNGTPGEVAVHYEVQERPCSTVGQIFVVGNDVTRQNVILRQLPLYPGQVLTYPDLRLAEANLARLNIFEANQQSGVRPTVEVLDPDSDNPVKDILVNVQESKTGSLMFGLGVNSDAGLTGSIVLNERNFDIARPPSSWDDLLSGRAFRGAGQEFRLEAVPGTSVQRYTASFREPFLFDSQYSLGVSGYYYDRVYNEYTESRLGARFTLGRRLNEYWSVNANLRVENVGVNNVPFYAPSEFTSVAGDNLLVGLRAGVTRDTRNNYLRPSEGSMIEASVEECMGEFTFPLATIEANKYFTVYQRADGSGRHVIAARSQLSYAGSQAPVYETFYAGGFRSIRGFEFRGVSPRVNDFAVGGDFMFLNSVEYQVPILPNDQLYLVGFVDSGTVESKPSLDNYRVSVGGGLRIVVPMLGPVPVALDFGYPVVRPEFDRRQVFSFWLGFFH